MLENLWVPLFQQDLVITNNLKKMKVIVIITKRESCPLCTISHEPTRTAAADAAKLEMFRPF